LALAREQILEHDAARRTVSDAAIPDLKRSILDFDGLKSGGS
jgi:hypothetical protein